MFAVDTSRRFRLRKAVAGLAVITMVGGLAGVFSTATANAAEEPAVSEYVDGSKMGDKEAVVLEDSTTDEASEVESEEAVTTEGGDAATEDAAATDTSDEEAVVLEDDSNIATTSDTATAGQTVEIDGEVIDLSAVEIVPITLDAKAPSDATTDTDGGNVIVVDGETIDLDSIDIVPIEMDADASEPVTAPADNAGTDDDEPVSNTPVVTKPETTKPVVTKPETTKPVVTKPATTKPETTKPASTTPVTSKPSAATPVASVPDEDDAWVEVADEPETVTKSGPKVVTAPVVADTSATDSNVDDAEPAVTSSADTSDDETVVLGNTVTNEPAAASDSEELAFTGSNTATMLSFALFLLGAGMGVLWFQMGRRERAFH